MSHDPESMALRATLERLQPMLGRWQGSGRGKYPTIDSFEYREDLRFEMHNEYPIIFYEQKTVLRDGTASHWETGFVRPVEGGAVELSNVQDSGRVEVLRGDVPTSDFVLSLESIHHGHDPRVLQTERVFRLDGDVLRYEVKMATNTTHEPLLQVHLSAELRRGG